MNRLRPGFALLFVQLLLVLTIAGKFLYERQTRPRVWTRAVQFDPALPLRGRYLAMQLVLDACGLPRNAPLRHYPSGSFWQWRVSLSASGGKLVPHVEQSTSPSTATLTLSDGKSCNHATLSGSQLLFIPDRAQLPLPLAANQELWVEVTVPPSGPPRPIRIAVSGPGGFHPINLD